ncbi:MAG: adenosine deaminase [Spirochaetales bacterium]|nr:adenosine deaminase [Spirochaetales bacterium]
MLNLDLLKSLPKAEIHIHLEAVASYKTFLDLNNKYQLIDNLNSEEELKSFLLVQSLSEMIGKFLRFQQLFRCLDDYSPLVDDVVQYSKNFNIPYIEAFLSPSMVKKQGYVPVPDLFRYLDDRFAEIKKKEGIEIKLLIDLSRSFGVENAFENLQITKDYLAERPDSSIIGFGLGGGEQSNPAKDYGPVFEEARKTGLHLVAHAGEEVDSGSIREAIDYCYAERIGHGTSAYSDPDMIKRLRDLKMPLEVCVTSNVFTKKYVKDYSDHPIKKFIDEGIVVTVNTDDPILFDTDMNREIEYLHKKCGLDLSTLLDLLKNNIIYSFMEEPAKKKMLAHYNLS